MGIWAGVCKLKLFFYMLVAIDKIMSHVYCMEAVAELLLDCSSLQVGSSE